MSLRQRSFLFAVIAAVLLAVLFHSPVLTAMGSYLQKTDPLAKADVALVLDGDGTGLRILKGAELVRHGYAPQVLVSGAIANYGVHSCDLAIPFAVRHGFPESYFVHLESDAHSTEEEARYAIAEIRRKGFHRILVVTSNYHTRRATSLYRSQAPDLTFIAVAAPDAYFTPDGWWHNREGRKTFLYEWEKTVATWFGI